MTSTLTRTALALGALLLLSACNNQNSTAGNPTGSGSGPTNNAGASNTPGTASNGGPSTP